MARIQLVGKVIISGELRTVTGLHIGGASAGLDIGGIDNPIIRHPVTREPYVPGSSLRGKMRSLLDRHLGNEANQSIGRDVNIHICKDTASYLQCPVCQIFGITPPDLRDGSSRYKPTRLVVRDTLLDRNNAAYTKLENAKTDLPFTEVKWEATIDRVTSAAVPRQNERVPAGAVFAPFELVYTLYALNGESETTDVTWLKHLFLGLELLEDDYLGGYGARGAGKIAFENIQIHFKSHSYYEGTAEAIELAKVESVAALKKDDLVNKVRDAVGKA